MAGAGLASDTETSGRWCVENRQQQKIDPSLMANNTGRPFFSGFGEEDAGRRGQPLTPYTTDPPDIFKAVIYIHWPCPTRSGLAVD